MNSQLPQVYSSNPNTDMLNALIQMYAKMQGMQGMPSGGGGSPAFSPSMFESLFGGGGGSAGAVSGDSSSAASSSGGSSLSSVGLPALYAAMIGVGKNTEQKNANNPIGDTLLSLLGPSAAQVKKDPVGMGLPALFGLPFLSAFFGSKSAKGTAPEWQKLFPFGM